MENFTNRLGQDNFVWWIGVVEDRQDPLKMGRCRVRIFGIHSPNDQLISKDSLPWAQPLLPINGSLTTGTAQEGDYVFGFFFDGSSCQAPCMVGVIPGIPQNFVNGVETFADRRTAEELASSPKKPVISNSSWTEGTAKRNPSVLGEPTTSRLSRNVKISETLIGYRKTTLDENVPIAGGSTWSEPTTEYDSKNPYNRVLETESGHLLEFDDTSGKERVNLTHRKGSFVEFHSDGSKVTKIIGNNYEIFLQNNNIHVKGDCNITVDGNANIKASEILIEGNTTIDGDLNVTGTVTGDVDVVTGDGISLNDHVHTNVKSGPDLSGPPL